MNSYVERDPRLKEEIAEFEFLLKRQSADTFRPLGVLHSLVGFAGVEDLIRALKGKMVLDLGAGYCGLAIDAYVLAVPVDVHSVSISFGQNYFEEDRLQVMRRRGYLTDLNRGLVEVAINLANKKTYPFFAHDLGFPDASFDLIIDNWAVSLYTSEGFASVYRASIFEGLRVLRPGGYWLIGDPAYEQKWKPEAIKTICRDQGAQFRPLMFLNALQVGFRIDKLVK